jgi:hypothetical protein
MPARALVAVAEEDFGREVALMFEEGDPRRPIVLGLMHVPDPAPVVSACCALHSHDPAPEPESDHERLEFSAEREIVLRCGDASITLTREGKVLIRGAYLLSRSSGTNSIKGGSVQIN